MMADGAVNFLLNQISTWLQEETKLLRGLRGETRLIRDELEQMKAFLRVADYKEETDPLVKVLVRQIREIAYDVEDVLESYMLQCTSHDSSHGIKARAEKIYASIKNLKAKHRVASEIKELRSRAENATKKFKEMHEVLTPASSSSGIVSEEQYDGRGDALLLEDADVVGIERPKEQLLEWILASNYTLKVVSVVGMAGLGKTTLVKKLYDAPLVRQELGHRIWISVSETYKVENLLQDMIKQLLEGVKQSPPVGLESMNSDRMKDFIYNFLVDKKYIIVLDDVWRLDVWEAIRYSFPRQNTQGRGCIIITSRFVNIGDYACSESGGNVYNIQPLSPNESRQLFYKKAFPHGLSCPHHLEEISTQILQKLKGLPLAIVLIGGVLATKGNNIKEWNEFSHSLGYQLEGHELMRMKRLLSLSYYDLPYYLKSCLLFLSIFPEDHLLERATIIRLWIAEGLVEPKEGKSIEEIADGYLNDLSSRSLIQVVTVSYYGKPRNFRIHDLVREYLVSRATEQNLTPGRIRTTLDGQVRRLGLQDSFVGHVSQINKFKRLRTLLYFGSNDLQWQSIICKVLGADCRMLKELDLRRAPLDAIPDEVFELYGLKYLCLRYTNVSVIPKLIRNLKKLETLDLKETEVTELPMEILKLQSLRYLLVYKYQPGQYRPFDTIQSIKAPYDIGKLECLQKLCYIDASVSGEGTRMVREIRKLTKLQRLGIGKLKREHGNDFCSSLANLNSLVSLYISSSEEDEVMDLDYHMPRPSLQSLRSLDIKGRLERVPQWIPSLIALTRLQLRWNKLVEDPLEYLQGLPNLEVLSMGYGAYDGEEVIFKSGGFPRLKTLTLVRLTRLRWVVVEKGSMLRLKTFEILNCEAMMELPMGFEHLTNLSEVDFVDMADEFLNNLVRDERIHGNFTVIIDKFGRRWRL